MPQIPTWQEAESKVYRPGLWPAFVAGIVFVLMGVGFLAMMRSSVSSSIPVWVFKLIPGTSVLVGGIILAWALKCILKPIHIRHAVPDVLPNVPAEPVICEGSTVHGRLTHELCRTGQGWEFRPAGGVWRNDKCFLYGFGIPFLIGFSGVLAWVVHGQWSKVGWPVSAVIGIIGTAVCGGSVFLLIGMVMRSGYRRLSTLTIPGGENDLELEAAEAPEMENGDLGEGLKWLVTGENKRQRLTIPRGQVVAVQLCPWKFVTGVGETTWSVQGLLVLAISETAAYSRLPVLLTGDFVGAAQLMRRLADTLQVPYLFGADTVGWQAEIARAKSRPPLRRGGHM
jgi:hypothetical protein